MRQVGDLGLGAPDALLRHRVAGEELLEGRGPPVPLGGGKTRLEARSGHAPALCSHQGNLILAWTGTDRHINLAYPAAGSPGTPVRLEDARSDRAPALCSYRGGLILAWSGTDRRLNLARLQ